jgi:hypothetical protein
MHPLKRVFLVNMASYRYMTHGHLQHHFFLEFHSRGGGDHHGNFLFRPSVQQNFIEDNLLQYNIARL